MNKPNTYLAIALWGKQLGSMPYYITNQQELASREGAPIDAIYLGHNGKWVTVEDLRERHPFRTTYEMVLRRGA